MRVRLPPAPLFREFGGFSTSRAQKETPNGNNATSAVGHHVRARPSSTLLIFKRLLRNVNLATGVRCTLQNPGSPVNHLDVSDNWPFLGERAIVIGLNIQQADR